MSAAITTAIILAAGRGTRLRNTWPDLPKGFVEIDGEPLIERSLRLLSQAGITRMVIVAGYKAEVYEALAARRTGVEVTLNTEYATTESMASLARALDIVDDDFLLLESDLFYEPRALRTLLDSAEPDSLLASAPTGATDEVWIDAPQAKLRRLSKRRSEIDDPAGEFVGILRISRALGRRMHADYRAFVETKGHGRMAYETEALVGAAVEHPVHVEVVPDLLWGEVDYESHYHRLVDEVVPELARRSAAPRFERRVLLNPGPATTSDTVKQALVMPDVCPREEEFCQRVADVRRRLAAVAGDPAEVTAIPVVGSGTTALEATLVSFVPDEGEVIFVENGDYGTRLIEMAKTYGIAHSVVAPGWGVPVDPDELARVMSERAGRATHLFFVHHETSSGLLNPLDVLARLGHEHGLCVMVDAMSSYGVLDVPVGGAGDASTADVIVASANKCIQGMAGLAFAIARRSVVEDARGVTPRSFVLNLVAEYDHLERTGQSRFTLPPQVLSALQQALIEFEEEGLAGRRARYERSMQTLVAGLRELDFELLLEDDVQSGILVAIREPAAAWYDFDSLHDAMYAEGFTIYPGKAGAEPTFRLSVLGAISSTDIEGFLAALRRYLDRVR